MKIDIVRNPKGYVNVQEASRAFSLGVGQMKLFCGICNNATYLVMQEAFKRIQSHPNYKGKAKRLFLDAMKAWRVYESSLLYPTTGSQIFHLETMEAETRERYRNITNREYFEFWQGSGGVAYAKTKPLVTSLVNKYRLSFESNGIGDAENVAWVMTALSCLEICRYVYEATMKWVQRESGLTEEIRRACCGLSVEKPCVTWTHALFNLEPMTLKELVRFDECNIAYGISQLQEAWTSPETVYGYWGYAVEDYKDVFRSKREMRSLAAGIRQYEEELAEDIKRDNLESLKNKIMKEERV